MVNVLRVLVPVFMGVNAFFLWQNDERCGIINFHLGKSYIRKEKHRGVRSESQTRAVVGICDLSIVILTKRIVKKQRVKSARKCGGNRCVPVSEARNPEQVFNSFPRNAQPGRGATPSKTRNIFFDVLHKGTIRFKI